MVALLVLGTLAVSGLVTLEEALAGFSNPAVVTVWAMFILSAGLSATGVADVIGRQVLTLAGTGETADDPRDHAHRRRALGLHEQHRRRRADAAGGDGHRPAHPHPARRAC